MLTRQIVFVFAVAAQHRDWLPYPRGCIVRALVLYRTREGRNKVAQLRTDPAGARGSEYACDRGHLDPLRSRQPLLVHRQGRRVDSVGATMTEQVSGMRIGSSRRAQRVGL